MIQFKNVSKVFHGQTIIDDISFVIEDGEFVVLLGESGCGKTTTLKMINKLISPSSGTVEINGQDIGDADPIALRRRMGYVIQQIGLFPHMTVRENIEIIAKMNNKDKGRLEQNARRLMEMVNLDPDQFLDAYPSEMSGGQQQRAGVVRAFMTDPEIILMDEPFSALDPITRTQIQNALIDMQTALKRTIVFVTHDMDEAIRLAERYGADVEKARVAALLHDCTKKLDMEEQLALCRRYGIQLDELEQKALKLLHAKTGAAIARDVFGVDDEIYRAIWWHTTGHAHMTLLEKIIYLADYIEPSRDFPGVDKLRSVCYKDLDEGLLLGLEMTIEEMTSMGNPVHHATIEARDALKG